VGWNLETKQYNIFHVAGISVHHQDEHPYEQLPRFMLKKKRELENPGTAGLQFPPLRG
jgi:hypothetical protein